MILRSKHAAKRRGQALIEYSIMFAVVVIVIVAIQLYFKRAVQGRWKSSSDQIGEQFTTGEFYSIETRQSSARKEQTGATTQIGNGFWTESAVELNEFNSAGGSTLAGVGSKIGAYNGAEITQTDYINQAGALGTGNLGTHAVFSSGQMANKSLFNDQ
jgi:Flp pilus assembly pilin Flp